MNRAEPVYITIIGCGDAFANGGRHQTCFYVKTSGTRFLVDCGAGTLTALKQHGLEMTDVDIIFISHFHGDHYGGLPYLLLESAVKQRAELLTIVSPPGCEDRIAGLLHLLYPGTDVLSKLNIRFMSYGDNRELAVDDLLVRAIPVLHKKETHPHGLRITIGEKVISYSGDSGWCPALIALAQDADLFICECNFFEQAVDGHLNYRTLTGHLHEMACKKIVLTHLDQEMLLNRDRIKLPCAYDGMEIVI